VLLWRSTGILPVCITAVSAVFFLFFLLLSKKQQSTAKMAVLHMGETPMLLY
jgi:hypothetical protein